MEETPETSGIDRRSLIKKAAVGTAVVWTAPVVASFTTPAAAAGSGGPNPECRGATCGNFIACAEDPDCVCGTTAQGGGVCLDGTILCDNLVACTADNTCEDPNSVCFVGSCCGDPVCVPTSDFCAPSTGARHDNLTRGAQQFGSRTFAGR